MNACDPLAGWIPLFLSSHRGEVEWGYMGDERFTEPFCQETLQKLACRPFNQLFRRKSRLDLLLERAQNRPGLPLNGIIFHMSRCGSTLTSQWLAALPDSVVLSEPEPVDTLLQWLPPYGGEILLQGLLSAMGQPRRESDLSLFLKTNCEHLLHIDRLLAAFPGTPWIFMYRDPVEVMVSHQRMPGWLVVPGSLAGHGLYPPDELMCNPLGNAAWILSMILQQAQQAMTRHGNGLLLNYSELPRALDTRLAAHFSIDSSTLTSVAFNAVTARHSKRRDEFRPDAVEKRAAADRVILDLAERWLYEPYRQLEALRLEGIDPDHFGPP